MKKAAAIIPAAGSGTRMKLDHPKQYHPLAGSPILIHTIEAFLASPVIGQIIVVVPRDMLEETAELLRKYDLNDPRVEITPGGKRRQDSVFNGLQLIHPEIDTVLVHDGARPLVSLQLIEECYLAAVQYGAAIAAIPVKDTLKKGSDKAIITETIDRDGVWQAQTPQAAKLSLLLDAYKKNGDADFTDEAGLLEKIGIPVKLVEGSDTNLKITRPEDLSIAERLLLKDDMKPIFKIGHGFDAHRFAASRDLVLGGVTIPHPHGLAGHSDADVLTHAICDALLGALGKGDIGKHFPDSSDSYKNIYSINLLEKVIELVKEEGFILSNLDATIVCQRPKLAGHIEQMREIIAGACGVEPGLINIKATTTEKMGFTGREEGISSHAVVLIQTQ